MKDSMGNQTSMSPQRELTRDELIHELQAMREENARLAKQKGVLENRSLEAESQNIALNRDNKLLREQVNNLRQELDKAKDVKVVDERQFDSLQSSFKELSSLQEDLIRQVALLECGKIRIEDFFSFVREGFPVYTQIRDEVRI